MTLDYSRIIERIKREGLTPTTRPVATPPRNPPAGSGNLPTNQDYIFVPELGLWIAKQRTHQGKDWNQAHEELRKENSRMLTIPEFIGFVNYLRNGYSDRQEAEQILDDILTKKDPWRAEHLDAYFEISPQGNYILTQNKTHREILETCLMQDCKADVFKNANSQGLPTQTGNEFDYWFPRNNCVARFYAGSCWSLLYCGRDPTDADSRLGVRRARTAVC